MHRGVPTGASIEHLGGRLTPGTWRRPSPACGGEHDRLARSKLRRWPARNSGRSRRPRAAAGSAAGRTRRTPDPARVAGGSGACRHLSGSGCLCVRCRRGSRRRDSPRCSARRASAGMTWSSVRSRTRLPQYWQVSSSRRRILARVGRRIMRGTRTLASNCTMTGSSVSEVTRLDGLLDHLRALLIDEGDFLLGEQHNQASLRDHRERLQRGVQYQHWHRRLPSFSDHTTRRYTAAAGGVARSPRLQRGAGIGLSSPSMASASSLQPTAFQTADDVVRCRINDKKHAPAVGVAASELVAYVHVTLACMACSSKLDLPAKATPLARLSCSRLMRGLVGVRGLEPPTSASRTLRASRLRYTPR